MDIPLAYYLNKSEKMSEKLLSIREVADYLNVSEQAIYNMTMPKAKTRIPFMKIGGRLRFDLAKIKEWLETKEVAA